MAEQNKIFQPASFIETAQVLQTQIEQAQFDMKPIEGQKAVDLLGPTKEYAGVRTAIIHALSSFIVLENMDRADVSAIPQDEMFVRGYISGISYLEDNFALSSLCVTLLGSTVLWRKNQSGIERTRIDDKLLIPVFSVESILVAT